MAHAEIFMGGAVLGWLMITNGTYLWFCCSRCHDRGVALGVITDSFVFDVH